jgi:hypothetical protein
MGKNAACEALQGGRVQSFGAQQKINKFGEHINMSFEDSERLNCAGRPQLTVLCFWLTVQYIDDLCLIADCRPFPNAGLQHLYCLHSGISDCDTLNDRKIVIALDYGQPFTLIINAKLAYVQPESPSDDRVPCLVYCGGVK